MGVVPKLQKTLKSDYWQAIGELHLFAPDSRSPVFKNVVELAYEHQLPLLIHSDPLVIDTLYELAPNQRVIWAHAGAYPYPDLLADYLQRYPMLMVDLSMRDERIAPGGVLDGAWEDVFFQFPERFMIGVDTYSPSRWRNYDAAVETIQHWLSQLPKDIAEGIGFGNAARLYGKSLEAP